MIESQNIEYKQIWNDEYIKWVCGFANANGGKIYIGIDDSGNVKGLNDAKRLLEEIPNKTKDILGILVDVNLKIKSKKNYLEIVIEPYPYPVSYKGHYYYRTGSTKQELKGSALDKFILQKQGKRWDSVPQPDLTIKELSKDAFAYFKNKAAETKRIGSDLLKVKPQLLLEKLHLKTGSGYLKRAVVLLFHSNPEKYVTGAYIKIGFFQSDEELVYQDEVHGDLFEQVEKTMDLLLTKYLKANISYQGIHRVERYPVPEAALREAVLNSIVHKDYSSGNPVQISVYSDKVIIWNDGELPEGWTVDKLKIKHSSRPFNPDIANCFFRAGLIEAWGRGTLKIIQECKKAKAQFPVFSYEPSEFSIEFRYEKIKIQKSIFEKRTPDSSEEKVIKLIRQNENITIPELAIKIGVTEMTINRLLKELKGVNRIIRTGSRKTGKWKVKF